MLIYYIKSKLCLVACLRKRKKFENLKCGASRLSHFSCLLGPAAYSAALVNIMLSFMLKSNPNI